MLYQLHWQNRSKLNQTEMVAQCSDDEGVDPQEYFRDVIMQRREECPEGWIPLVCSEKSEYFWWANPKTVDIDPGESWDGEPQVHEE